MLKLSDEIKLEILRLRSEGFSGTHIGESLGIGKSTVNDFLSMSSHKDFWEKYSDKPVATGTKYDHWSTLQKREGNRFIVMGAQNNTYVHKEFLQSLEVASEYYNAEIIAGSWTYNTTGFQNLEKDSEGVWYDPLIRGYIVEEPVMLADDLVFAAELNILPTAVNPLSGLHSYSKGYSAIVPHAKVQMESLPTHKSKPARSLFTTGSVTKRNYIAKKSGQKASFHHVFGALLVEVSDDGNWFVRQLIAETSTGHFYDLDKKFTPEGVTDGHRAEAITYGDIHSEKMDWDACIASFGRTGNSMVDVLRPKYQFVHDVMDFTTRNHHNRNDPYFRWETNHHLVQQDINEVCSTLKMMDRGDTQTVVVESNHDLALKRWLKEADYKNDNIHNAITYLELQKRLLEAIRERDEDFNIFEWKVKKTDPSLSECRFLKTDESFMICGKDGIENGCHGHNGANGSRGGVGVFQKMGTRYTVGHSHTPAIKDGVYVVGVLGELDMGYNIGGSSWQHANCVTYQNGKRSLYFIKNGKWRI